MGTGVTNPMTRHAAVAASAFSTLQVVSNGRTYLGIGRGVIAMAARLADRIDLMLGASAKRVAWGMELAREARRSAGMRGDIPVAAYVNLVVHDDGELARKLAAPAIKQPARARTVALWRG